MRPAHAPGPRPMKVLLANPPWQRPGWHGVRAGSRWPHMERADSPYMPFPFLLGYAAAVLEDDGVEVEVIDACAERLDREAFLDRFEVADPDVAFFEISTPSMTEDLATLQGVRDRGFSGSLLVGGLHKPMAEPAFLERQPLIDGACVGEYEMTLRELARQGGRTSEGIDGLIWRDGQRILNGGRKPSQQGLDELPWPARHLFAMDRYHDLPGGIPAPSVQMWASRGCSFTCNFCAWPQILYADHMYRTRSPHKVADEVLALQAQGYESVYFDDDTFNLGKRRTAELSAAFRERGISMPWAFMGRADTCDPAQYEDLVGTGLQAVKYGVESADTARLKQIGKNLDVGKVRQSIAMVKSLGVKVHLTFMFGLQGETYETMQRTLDLAYELDPDSAQFTIATPFPGSRLYEELEDAGRLDGLDFSDLDGYRTGIVSTEALEAEQIVAFVHGIHRRWEQRPRPAGPAPIIPVSEIGGSGLSVALLARPGEAAWLRQALEALVAEPGPARELVVVADRADPDLEATAAETCDWATFVDAEPAEPYAVMANRVLDRCTGRWIATLHSGAVPREGWLQAVLDASRQHPDAGALVVPVHQMGRPPFPAALAMSRWGRVARAEPSSQAFATSSCAGVYSRALLEDTQGFDPQLPAELADADLALRGLLLGYGTAWAGGPGVAAGPELRLLREEGPANPTLSHAWARGRVRLAIRSLPREAWGDAAPALLADLLADLARGARGGQHPAALLAGAVAGLRDARGFLEERRTTLGRRRVGPDYVRDVFVDSEASLTSPWQRLLALWVS